MSPARLPASKSSLTLCRSPRPRPCAPSRNWSFLRFQALKRDFAFVVDKKTDAQAILKAAGSADKKLITALTVFDHFEGAALGEGKKSIAIEVTIQPMEKTLDEAEIEALGRRIVESVGRATGGVLRG